MKETTKNILFLVINCVVAICNILSNFLGGATL